MSRSPEITKFSYGRSAIFVDKAAKAAEAAEAASAAEADKKFETSVIKRPVFVAIIGPTRCGKTTLAKDLFADIFCEFWDDLSTNRDEQDFLLKWLEKADRPDSLVITSTDIMAIPMELSDRIDYWFFFYDSSYKQKYNLDLIQKILSPSKDIVSKDIVSKDIVSKDIVSKDILSQISARGKFSTLVLDVAKRSLHWYTADLSHAARFHD